MAARGLVQRLMTPARPAVPHARWWKIAFRTAHLMTTGVLVGGHAFGAPTDALFLLLCASAASGLALILLEAGLTLHWVFEGWGLLVLAKLAALAAIPFFWTARVALLLVAIGLAGVGSHMAARYRHYSVFYRRVIVE